MEGSLTLHCVSHSHVVDALTQEATHIWTSARDCLLLVITFDFKKIKNFIEISSLGKSSLL
jgi:hypothetical protein